MAGRKKKELPLLEDVRIESMAAEGKAVAHVQEKVLFVPYAAPEDICRVQITKKKSRYMEGRIESIITPSPHRQEPRCIHFTYCGGCKWQHIPYEMQLAAKAQQVRDALERIGHISVEEYLPICGCREDLPQGILEYRNKLEYTFSNKKWVTYEDLQTLPDDLPESSWCGLGFHVPGMFDKVLDIDTCYLGPEISNRIRNFIRRYTLDRLDLYPYYDLRNHTGVMRTLMIRTTTTSQVMVVLVFAQDEEEPRIAILEALKQEFPEITSLFYVINSKLNDSLADQQPILYYGEDAIVEKMGDLNYRIGPKTFYQTNSRQAEVLYRRVKDLAGLAANDVVYDLYTGAGTIANYLARSVKKVVGIEYVPEAVEDAYVNSRLNGIENTEFFAGDMKDILTPAFVAEHGTPDVIVTDPPRSGMHPDVIEVIGASRPKKIVYVSCNPTTQARDLELLLKQGNYRVCASQAVDMFPQTHHVENIVLLVRE